ncbi:MAG: DUF502 domain-containing protein [Candidatus Hydrogenedentes bacterium]|nr:DUF502 domain-containing protein [Candidatus Hydrogenedentota bacterium]
MGRSKQQPGGVRSAFLSRLQTTVRGYILRGMLVLVPLGVTAYVLKLCYGLTAGMLVPWLRRYTGEMPGYAIALLSVCLFVAILYVIGLAAGLVLGKRLIAVGEWILARIPVVKTIYGASRQAVDVLSIQSEGPSYKAAALVPFPSPSVRAIAFVTGRLTIDGKEGFCRTFVPTTPNPTSGYFEIYPEEMIQLTNLTVEDAAKAFMSAGILTPERLSLPESASLDTARKPVAAQEPLTIATRLAAAPKSLFRRVVKSTRNRLVSGLLVLVPIGVTIFIVTFIYGLTAGRIEPLARMISGPLPPYVIGFISILLLLISLYLTGQVATAVVGARLIRLMESIINRMPLITTIYGATKQIIESLIDPGSGPKFEAPVLVEFPYPGVRTIGFVVGRIVGIDGQELLKIFVPTTPNITVGLLELCDPATVTGCSLTLEEAVKMVVSGGIVGDEALYTRPLSEVLKPKPAPDASETDTSG